MANTSVEVGTIVLAWVKSNNGDLVALPDMELSYLHNCLKLCLRKLEEAKDLEAAAILHDIELPKSYTGTGSSVEVREIKRTIGHLVTEINKREESDDRE